MNLNTLAPTWHWDASAKQIACQGAWNILSLTAEFESAFLNAHFGTVDTLNTQAISDMDMSAALLLLKFSKQYPQAKLVCTQEQEKLFQLIQEYPLASALKAPPRKPRLPWLAHLGKVAYHGYLESLLYLGFVGEVFCYFLEWIIHPSKILWRNIAKIIETAGYFGMPIIGLLSFLVGVVLAYQMGAQLENYGANIYVVNLLGISILREFAPLMTAIIVAGRTGAAFTAELGTMQVNQEIDALKTMGVKPIQYLALPKIVGLMLTMPLLTMWASFAGLMGGMLMSEWMLDITFPVFLHQFEQGVAIKQLWIGLFKTPFFAFLIASIGCFQGFQVQMGASGVGRQTTRSVVQALFLIIVADAFFSILLSLFHA